jgi:hypothetical protein
MLVETHTGAECCGAMLRNVLECSVPNRVALPILKCIDNHTWHAGYDFINSAEKTAAHYLSSKGYQTAHFGKW